MPASYGSIEGGKSEAVQVRSRMSKLAVATGTIAAICLLALTMVQPKLEGSELLQSSRPAPRKEQLANLITAPLEGMAKTVGSAIRSSLSDGVPTFSSSGSSSPPQPTPQDYECYFESDAFNKLVQSCCKTIYISPEASNELPLHFALGPPQSPAADGMPFGVRFRYIIGRGNDMVFNGANERTIAFINRYFGFDIKLIPSTTTYRKQIHTYVLGDPNPPKEFVEFISMLPEELPQYEGLQVVDTATLPPHTSVVYSNSPYTPEASPLFVIKYCEAKDPSGNLNYGLPMKVQPTDCPLLGTMGIVCNCGNIIFLGWVWPEAPQNIWEHSLIKIDEAAVNGCKPGEEPEGPEPMPAVPAPPPYKPQTPEEACKDAPDFDPAAQHWFYWKEESDGSKTKMVRHWCPSAWVPQEIWYKYQRYLPRTKNNMPPPPINDFDFMNSYARDDYYVSRAKAEKEANQGRFDDWTLGNSGADLSREKYYPNFNDNDIGNSGAGLNRDRPEPKLDDWNLGKMTCVGSDCYDSKMHGGAHMNGVQPYDDYGSVKAMNGQRLMQRFDSDAKRIGNTRQNDREIKNVLGRPDRGP